MARLSGRTAKARTGRQLAAPGPRGANGESEDANPS